MQVLPFACSLALASLVPSGSFVEARGWDRRLCTLRLPPSMLCDISDDERLK